ncbi:hypothetical protein ABG067_005620 [Albugo candida]
MKTINLSVLYTTLTSYVAGQNMPSSADTTMQNLAEQAEHFVNMCKEGGYGDSVSGSTDGSGEAGSKKDGTESVVKDEKSNAPFHSFGAAFIAASWFVLALP